VVLFDELKEQPVGTSQKIYEFLEVDRDFVPEVRVHNRGRFPLCVYAQHLVMHRLQDYLSKYRVPEKNIQTIKRSMFSANIRLARLYPRELKENTRHNLLLRFRDDIQKTASLIGCDLDRWSN
jgi:hypothetical protein